MLSRSVHQFANNVKVFDDHLLPLQRARYERSNVHEEQEENIFLALLHAMPNGAAFVNIGTAIGYYALLGKLKRPDLQIYCVEPLPRHVACFHENIPLNGLRPQDFVILNEAIAPQEGFAWLTENDYSSRIIEKASSDTVSHRVLKVRSITLTGLCQRIGHPIGLVQMDIQGMEHLVLSEYSSMFRGAALPVASFLVGTHGCALHDQCKETLQTLGYKITCDEPVPNGQPDGILTATLEG
jgi:FkbM family methyltransferase